MATLKEDLEAAVAEATSLKTKLLAAEDSAKTNKTLADQLGADLKTALADKDSFKTKLEASETALKTAQAENAKLTEENSKLKAADTSVTGKAAEQLAAVGITSSKKDTPASLQGPLAGGGDPALWEQYQAADPTTKAELLATKGKELEAAAKAFDSAKAGK